MRPHQLFLAMVLPALLSGCGAYTPSKNLLFSDEAPPAPRHSEESIYENQIVEHIACELATGLADVQRRFELPWLSKWGTAVTLTITSEDQTGANPGVSFLTPMRNVVSTFSRGGNVTSPQSFSLGLGASGALNATRTETIQYTYRNSDLLMIASKTGSCTEYQNGFQIDGDLKIRQFLYDKAVLARTGNTSDFIPKNDPTAHLVWQWPTFNTFTEEITFLAAFGGNITPTWKLARISADTSGSLLAGERTSTNDLIITLGPIGKQPSKDQATALGQDAQNQHNARVQGSALATSVQSQAH